MEAEKLFEHKRVADTLQAANDRFLRSEAIAAGMEVVCNGIDFAEQGYKQIKVRHAPEKFDDRLPQLLLVDGVLTMYVSPRAELDGLCRQVERMLHVKRVSTLTFSNELIAVTLGW